jgi:hypothetical protein
MVRPLTARVLMMTPDLNDPIGGIKVHYQMVDALNRAGVEAMVVHREPGFRCTWFDNSTRIVSVESLRATRNDVVVVPEEWTAYIPDLPVEIRKVVFNQNAYSTFSWGADAALVRDVLNRPDVERVVVVSEDNASYVRYAFPSIDVRRVRGTIDQSVFNSPPDVRKRKQLAYMPRRRERESSDVLSLLRSRDALGDWRIVPIDNVPEARVAATLQQSAIFLCFSLREGLGLPPAEAMACGCVVIGFHGFGGRDFGENAIWVPEGDVVEFARAVESALATWESDVARFDSLRDRAGAHIRETYGPANTERDVREAFGFSTSDVAAGESFTLSDSMWQELPFVHKLRTRARVVTRALLTGRAT